MLRGLGRRIAVAVLAATAAALLLVLAFLGPSLNRLLLDRLGRSLTDDARLVSRLVAEPLSRGAGRGDLDPLVAGVARDLEVRVSVLDPSGRILSDSGAPVDPDSLRSRSEVQDAMRSGTGLAIRQGSDGSNYLYTATTVRDGGRVAGVVRLALPLEGARAQITDLWRALWGGVILAFLVAAGLSAMLSASFARPLREIMDTAREVARGNLDARIPLRGDDELAELSRVVNNAVEQLQRRLLENARDRVRTDAVLSAMEDGVLAVDDRGVVLLANDILRRNLDLQDPVGRHYVEVIRQREVGDVLQGVLQTGERRALEVPIRRLHRVYALTAVPFPGAEGMPNGAVLTFHDITERRRLEQVRRDFVANASHELRTPLTSIRGFVEALEDGAVGDAHTAERFLGKIHLHADRMAALVEDLLELSRLESGERPPRWEEVAPAELAEDVVASFSGLAERRNTRLVRSESDPASPVITDADRLRRILENLVDNAIKYTPPGGRVVVSSRRGEGGSAVLEVSDNGPGIAGEHLPRIFERFYRVDKARSREMGGTGLGLAIVKHLAEGMGANVTVTSEVGRGTCFTVTVPAGREHALSA